MKELREGYKALQVAMTRLNNAITTTTHQGDHTVLMTCSYNLERALSLIQWVGENLEKYKMFEE